MKGVMRSSIGSLVAALTVLVGAQVASAQEIEWVQQFGTSDFDAIYQVDDRLGDVFGVGEVDAAPGGCDVIVTRFGAVKRIWQFGTGGCDFAEGIAVGDDSFSIGGGTDGALTKRPNAGAFDAFVRRYRLDGITLWTRQFGTPGNDFVRGAAAQGDATYVAGSVRGALPGQQHRGASDVFVRRYDSKGEEVWTRQFGTPGIDAAREVDVVGSLVVVVGQVQGALPGQTSAGGTDVFVRIYTTAGKALWTQQFGTGGEDIAWGVDLHDGRIYVSGDVGGALPGETFAGGPLDAFVRAYDRAGNEVWTEQFGTGGFDRAIRVAADDEHVAVVGRVGGALPGQTFAGGATDPFVRLYEPDATELWTLQFGGELEPEAATGVALDDVSGDVFASGGIGGTFPGETSEGYIDAFVMRINAEDA